MEAVTFGRSVVEALPEEIENCGAERIFLIFSETLDRTTNEVQKLRTTLGSKLVGQFSSIGAHTPREGVIAATKEVRDTSADILVTFGGGSITDGAKAVTLCLANDIFKPEDIDLLLPQKESDGCLICNRYWRLSVYILQTSQPRWRCALNTCGKDFIVSIISAFGILILNCNFIAPFV